MAAVSAGAGAGRSARDRFIVLALWRMGLRRGELARLRREDVYRQPAHRPRPPPEVAALKDQVQALQQENLDLRRRSEERDEELAAAREANRRLMTELNKARS